MSRKRNGCVSDLVVGSPHPNRGRPEGNELGVVHGQELPWVVLGTIRFTDGTVPRDGRR